MHPLAHLRHPGALRPSTAAFRIGLGHPGGDGDSSAGQHGHHRRPRHGALLCAGRAPRSDTMADSNPWHLGAAARLSEPSRPGARRCRGQWPRTAQTPSTRRGRGASKPRRPRRVPEHDRETVRAVGVGARVTEPWRVRAEFLPPGAVRSLPTGVVRGRGPAASRRRGGTRAAAEPECSATAGRPDAGRPRMSHGSPEPGSVSIRRCSSSEVSWPIARSTTRPSASTARVTGSPRAPSSRGSSPSASTACG